jgi:hypothetical protein
MIRAGYLILIGMFLVGCRGERYFGPYDLQVPTELEEVAAGRTFTFPLDEDDNTEIDELLACLTDEPDRQPPCICDHPVLTIGEQVVRTDYRLVHHSGTPVNVMVFIGREVQPRESDPEMIPDLPRIEVLAEHHHQMSIGSSVESSFMEDEMTEVDLAYNAAVYPACPGAQNDLPAPLDLTFGLALDNPDATSQVSLEFSLRLKKND